MVLFLSYILIGILLLLHWTKDDTERYEEYFGICLLAILLWPLFLFYVLTDRL